MSTRFAVCVDLSEGAAPSRVDRAAGVIRGVKLLGWRSQNNRDYLPEGVDPALYEGRVVNFNHHKGSGDRSVYDRFGRVVNVVKRADGLYGDLEYLRSHPYAESVAEAAERMPNVYGLSHTASGRERRPAKVGGRLAVEKVESVESVDLVGDPATVAGLYESKGGRMALTVREIQETLQGRPRYAQALREMAEAGILSPSTTMDDPTPAPADAGDDHEQAILDAAVACIRDASLGVHDKLKKIKRLMKLVDKSAGGDMDAEDDTEGDNDDTPGEGGEMDESLKREAAEVKAKLARLESRERLRQVADEAGVKVTKALLEGVRDDLTLDQARALIAEVKTASRGYQQARSAAPVGTGGNGKASKGTVQESRDGVPADPKERAKWLAGR